MAEKIAEVAVRIGADTKGLRKGLTETETALDKLKSAGVGATKALAAGAAAAAAAVVALAAHGIALGDGLADAADKIGLTVTQLAGLRYSAQFAGIESAKLEQGVAKLGMQVSKAASGNKEAAASLNALGLSAEELRKLPLDEQMLRVADSLEGVKNQTDKLRLAQELFGRGAGTDFVGYFKQGTAAIREQLLEAQRLGLHMDGTQKRVVSEAADAQDKLKAAYDGLALQLGAAFAPALKVAENALVAVTVVITESIPKLQSYWEWLTGITTAASNLGDAALKQRLVHTYKELDGIDNKLADIRLSGMTPDQLAMDGNYQTLLHQRNELLARQKDLLTESVKRKRELASVPTPGGTDSGDDPIAAQAKEKHARSAAYANRVFEDATNTLAELYAANIKKLEDLDVEHYAVKIEALTGWQELEAQMALQHEDYLSKIKREGLDKRLEFERKHTIEKTAMVLDDLANMTAGVAQHSKKMFALNKAVALAAAVVNTAQGATKALAEYPPPISFIMAGAQIAAGAAQISAIKRTQFEGGGGGTTPTSAGSAPTVGGQPVQGAGAGGGNQRLTVEGLDPDSLLTGSAVRALAEKLLQHQKDGGTVVFHG